MIACIERAIYGREEEKPMTETRREAPHGRRCRRSPQRPPPRRSAWPRTPGTRAIRPAWRWPTRPTASGATAPNSSTAAAEIEAFLRRKWARELDYRLIKELWAFAGDRIAVRFAYEWHDDTGYWFRSYGNENWEFDADGLMQRRIASINEHSDRRGRPQVPLAARPAARRPSGTERLRVLIPPLRGVREGECPRSGRRGHGPQG